MRSHIMLRTLAVLVVLLLAACVTLLVLLLIKKPDTGKKGKKTPLTERNALGACLCVANADY